MFKKFTELRRHQYGVDRCLNTVKNMTLSLDHPWYGLASTSYQQISSGKSFSDISLRDLKNFEKLASRRIEIRLIMTLYMERALWRCSTHSPF